MAQSLPDPAESRQMGLGDDSLTLGGFPSGRSFFRPIEPYWPSLGKFFNFSSIEVHVPWFGFYGPDLPSWLKFVLILI